MKRTLIEERGGVSFFALCFLCASVLMASGLMYMARQGEDAIRHYEQEVQLRLDAEGFLERAVAGIEAQGMKVEGKLPVDEEVLWDESRNQRGIRLKLTAKRRDNGILLMSVAEDPEGGVTCFKTVQGFLERQEKGYAWKCWLH